MLGEKKITYLSDTKSYNMNCLYSPFFFNDIYQMKVILTFSS